MFTCHVGDAASVSWRVNRVPWFQLPLAFRNDTDLDYIEENNTYILFILAKPERNNTLIQCVTVGEEPERISEAAYLHVG